MYSITSIVHISHSYRNVITLKISYLPKYVCWSYRDFLTVNNTSHVSNVYIHCGDVITFSRPSDIPNVDTCCLIAMLFRLISQICPTCIYVVLWGCSSRRNIIIVIPPKRRKSSWYLTGYPPSVYTCSFTEILQHVITDNMSCLMSHTSCYWLSYMSVWRRGRSCSPLDEQS